jgi:trk system potassium uptake protein TrkA
MKIIILGAGQVGTALAEHLATEHNDITIIDIDGERLRTLQERMDIRTITGHGGYPSILRMGGAEEADMLIAVTSSDEINLVACQIAYTLFQTPTKIARVRSLHYLAHEELFGAATAFPVDVLISPEQLVSNAIRRLISYPNAFQVVDFADQKVQLVAIKTKPDSGNLVGKPLKELPQFMPYMDARVAAIFRQGHAIIPNGETIIEPHDEVFFIAAKEHIRHIMGEFIQLDPPTQRIMIAGGGNIGSRLASDLEDEFQVKVIERNRDRVEILATELRKSIVLKGDAADKELLQNENIEDTDVFCAVTNQDETNIMSSILAKRLGAKKVITLIVRPSFLEVIGGVEVDVVVSPQQVTIGSLLTHVRRGHVVNVHSLRNGSAEAIEVIVHGDKTTSKVVGRQIQDIALPSGATIAAVVRGSKILMGHHNVMIENSDRVILFLIDKSKIRQIEKLFQEEGTLGFI